MSTLKVTNIQATGETASRAVSGVAGAWVNYDASTAARDSTNISSLTDTSTGQTEVNFTNAFSSSNYSPSSAGANGTASGTSYSLTTDAYSTTSLGVETWAISSSSVARSDRAFNCINICGDLA